MFKISPLVWLFNFQYLTLLPKIRKIKPLVLSNVCTIFLLMNSEEKNCPKKKNEQQSESS